MLEICNSFIENLSNAAQSLDESMVMIDANIAKLNEERLSVLESYEAIKDAYNCLVNASEKQRKIPSANNTMEWETKTAITKMTNF